MKIRKPSLRVGVGLTTIALCAVVLGIMAASASALTMSQKSYVYDSCRLSGGNVSYCCHLIGGKYEAIYDENGNLVAESCTFSSDASQQSGPNFSTVNVHFANPGTGAATSGPASGGISNAGVNGLHQIYEPVSVIP
jgi:hypothetical protein